VTTYYGGWLAGSRVRRRNDPDRQLGTVLAVECGFEMARVLWDDGSQSEHRRGTLVNDWFERAVNSTERMTP
jgi:hypothetical protein